MHRGQCQLYAFGHADVGWLGRSDLIDGKSFTFVLLRWDLLWPYLLLVLDMG